MSETETWVVTGPDGFRWEGNAVSASAALHECFIYTLNPDIYILMTQAGYVAEKKTTMVEVRAEDLRSLLTYAAESERPDLPRGYRRLEAILARARA